MSDEILHGFFVNCFHPILRQFYLVMALLSYFISIDMRIHI